MFYKCLKIPKYSDTRNIAVIILKFYHRVMCPKVADGMANIVVSDQTAPRGADLGLHCFPRPVYPKTWDHCGRTNRPLYHHITTTNTILR